jgi:S1-C subfamily serine protease
MNRLPLLAALWLAAALPSQSAINRTLLRPDPDAARAGGPMAEAFARAKLAVVHVFVEVDGRNRFKLERPGSGVAVGPDGLVLTHAALCREGADADKQVFVQLADPARTRCPARILAEDEASGLALLKAELPDGLEWRPVELAASPLPGDPVAVLSFHDGEDQVGFAGAAMPAAAGIVVGDGAGRRAFEAGQILLTDAAIQKRSHGAALLDRRGALVGLCSADGVASEVSEPKLEDLKRPSFGFALSTATIRAAFGDALPAAVAAAPPSPEARAVAAIAQAVVAVQAGSGPRPDIGSDDPLAARRRPGVGSGVVIDPSGLVLTNLHLVRDAAEVTVTLDDRRRVPAEVVGTAPALNSALLRLALPAGTSIPAARRGSPPEVGATVLTVGRPEAEALNVGLGVLSAVRREALQVDASVGNQNGGGALISLSGDLIGIVDAGPVDRIDLSFAMRGDQAKLETNLNLVPAFEALLRAHPDGTRNVGPAAAAPDAGPVGALVRRTADSMLNIYIEVTTAAAEVEDNPFATPTPKTRIESLGSGVVIDRSGLALTNWHVVDAATEPDGSMVADRVVRAAIRDGRTFVARVLSISREEDLALLQLELEPGQELDAVELASSAELRIGDAAIAIGNPHGRASTVTAGIVSAKNQAIRVRGRWAKLPHLLETDAAINGGNSGGALLDAAGRLIGINSAGGSLHAVTGYAIAVDHVRERLHAVLLTPEKLRSPYLGLQVADRDGRLVVHAVDVFGPAARAGIERGDVLVTAAGNPLRWSIDLVRAQLAATPGEAFALEVERQGARRAIAVDPLSAAQWGVLRQTGLEVETVGIRAEPDLVRELSIAFYRAFTGDPGAAPALIPGGLVRVARLHPRLAEDGVDIQVGDFVLGVALVEEQRSGAAGRVIRFTEPAELQRCFDAHSSYEGQTFRAWIGRGGRVEVVDLPARRLIL